MTSSLWLQRYCARPEAQLKVFCLPYAGAGASAYRNWALSAPDDVEVISVQLPGRETRLSEPPLRSLEAAVDQLDLAALPELHGRYALFGHSMGALLSHAWAQRIAARGGAPPVHVFVSGRGAPHLPPRFDGHHRLPDNEFIRVLTDVYGAIPQAMLDEPDLLALYIKIFRADFALVHDYRCYNATRLSVPLTAFGGTHDLLVSTTALEDWRQCTTREVRVRLFDGGHLFMHQHREAILKDICAASVDAPMPRTDHESQRREIAVLVE